MAFAENLGSFLDPVGGFADEVTVTPQDGSHARTFLGIFDALFVDASTGDTNLETTRSAVECKASDSASLVRGDMLTVKGQDYDVVQVQPDGTGMATIILAER